MAEWPKQQYATHESESVVYSSLCYSTDRETAVLSVKPEHSSIDYNVSSPDTHVNLHM